MTDSKQTLRTPWYVIAVLFAGTYASQRFIGFEITAVWLLAFIVIGINEIVEQQRHE